MNLPQHFFENRKLENLVENRTTYTVANAELNVYETHHFAKEVILQFHQPVFASMIEGKKVMNIRNLSPFEFLPGESLIMPPEEVMKIDFPEAEMNNPTRCLAMTISPEIIRRVVEEINDMLPKLNTKEWQLKDVNFAFVNDGAITQIIHRLIFLFTENHRAKDMFVDMMLKELITRVLQIENRRFLVENSSVLASSDRLASTLAYIKKNIHTPLSIAELSGHACMSEPNFYKVFKRELGVTPIQFINHERIKKAKELLERPSIEVKDIYVICGFNNISYFFRTFKRFLGKTPNEYREDFLRKSGVW